MGTSTCLPRGPLIGILVGLLAGAPPVLAQMRPLTALRQAQAELAHAEAVATTTTDAEGADDPRSAAEAAERLDRARRTYHVARATFIDESSHPLIVAATKVPSEGGLPIVTVTLSARAVVLPPWIRESPFGVPHDEAPGVIRNVSVGLRNGEYAIISSPFQTSIPALTPGEKSIVRFRVREDVDVVAVEMAYGDRREVQLVRLDSGRQEPLRLHAIQVSQEADIGSSAVYALDLVRSLGSNPNVALRVTGLPEGFRAEFLLDANESATRLVRYRFPDQETSRRIALKVDLPQAGAGIALDEPLPFRAEVLATNPSRPPKSARPAAAVDLELVPRGVVGLSVTAPSYFVELPGGERTARIPVTIANDGSRALSDVEIDADLPLQWTLTSEESSIASLQPSATQVVYLNVTADDATGPGDYAVKVTAAAARPGGRITSEPASIRVRLTPATRPAVPLVLLGTLVGFLGLISYGSYRLARA